MLNHVIVPKVLLDLTFSAIYLNINRQILLYTRYIPHSNTDWGACYLI